ncbi:MAG: hypothetical protein ACUZ8H_16475 [Candidatus Anammoxibacter sp.]
MKRPKKPTAPKMSASILVWGNYKARLLKWKKRIAEIASNKTKKAQKKVSDRKKKDSIIKGARAIK